MIGARLLDKLGGIRKAAYALGGVLLCEIGARVALPGPNAEILSNAVSNSGQGGGGLLGIYSVLAGGALGRGSMLALGIMPYVSARMFVWLASTLSPGLQRLSASDAGRKTLTRWTRGLTTVLALIQSYGFARFTESLPGAVAQPGAGYVAQTMVLLTAGSLFMMWVCEQILAPEDVTSVHSEAARTAPMLERPGFATETRSRPSAASRSSTPVPLE